MRYIAHVHIGMGIRSIAIENNLAASTVSRQCARVEQRRDDLYFDALIDKICKEIDGFIADPFTQSKEEMLKMIQERQNNIQSDLKLEIESKRVLRRLNEKNAFLLLAPDLENAAVFREEKDGSLQRLTVTNRTVAEAFLLREWIEGKAETRIGRYVLTAKGRNALKRFISREKAQKELEEAELENSVLQNSVEFISRPQIDQSQIERPYKPRFRTHVTESPLAILARKKDRLGESYLTSRQVAAGERLREDFEVSQIGSRNLGSENYGNMGYARLKIYDVTQMSKGSIDARERMNAALGELGEGLADITFRCCCHLEGLETIEKKLGWSARSGKVVLRIALERLAQFYQIPERRQN